MDQDSFIRRYSSEWEWLRSTCAGGGTSLTRLSGEQVDEVVRTYLRVCGQLAEARGRYRDPSLIGHLNDTVRIAQVAVYGAAPRNQPGVFRLFGTRYRDAARGTAAFILIAGLLMLATTLGSWWWVAHSAEARAGLYPQEVVDSLGEEWDGRNPEVEATAGLAAFLWIHNVTVAFLAFALGITFGVGTLYVVAMNGVMLGSLAGVFTTVGKTGEFWAVILPHGMLELTAICIAAGAGLRIGWSLIEPGDVPRSIALREQAQGAGMVALGVVPAFAIAAVIEAFVSGTSFFPDGLEMIIGVVAAGGYLLFLLGTAPFTSAGRRIVSFARYSLPRAFMSR